MKVLLIALLSIIGFLSTPAYAATTWASVQTIPAVSPPSNARGAVRLAYDTTNNVVFAAWLDDTTGTPFFSIFNNTSGTWSTPAQIANDTTNSAVDLVYDSSAHIMVATWNDSSTNKPFYSFYNGSVWSSAAAISNAFVVFDDVRTTFDAGTGNIIAAWSDNNFPFSPFYSTYNSSTNTWAPPQVITLQQVFDDVTLTYDSGSNQVFASWLNNNTGLPSYAILTSGVWVSGSINLTDAGSAQNKNVLLTYDASNGQVYAAWGATNPLVSVFSNTNPTWSTPVAISILGALSSEVTLGYSTASTQVIAAWMDSGIPRYAITDKTGTTWTEGNISSSLVDNTAISLAFDSGLNEMFSAWSNASGGSPANPVYSTLLTPSPLVVGSLKGAQKVNDFGIVSELYNQLDWLPPTPGLSPVLGYHIYRDGILIATLPPTQLRYQDHNRKPGVNYLYAVAAFDINGEGSKATIGIPFAVV